MVERQAALEGLVINAGFWRGRRVFLTGHTGFKGGWTALVLRSLGAEVTGFSLEPEHPDGIFSAAQVSADVRHLIGDIRDPQALRAAIYEARPEIVLHMAAQSLVRRSYAAPVDTYATNVMGTVHMLEVMRQCPSVRGAIVVTSDKCYENAGHIHGYKEAEPLGGSDPVFQQDHHRGKRFQQARRDGGGIYAGTDGRTGCGSGFCQSILLSRSCCGTA